MKQGKRQSLDLGLELPPPKSKRKKEEPAPPSNSGDAVLASAKRVEVLSSALGDSNSGLAEEIDEELCKLHGDPASREFKNALRNLVANLRRNQTLRYNVCSHALSPSELVRMSPKEQATELHRAVVEKTESRMLDRSTMHSAVQGVATSDYVCPVPECKSRACSYVDAGRRDIGKSETWGAKDAQDKGRAITCLTCGHKWEADMC